MKTFLPRRLNLAGVAFLRHGRNVSQSPPSLPPRRRFWKWCRRLLIVTVLLLAGLAVFHRPILLATIRWIGPKAAAKLNLPLSWQVDGSLWGDFKLEDVETGGGEDHWLPKAKIGELSASYDWRLLKNGDFEHAVNRVTVHDLEAEVDLRKMPAGEVTEAPVQPNKKSGEMPPIVWPRTVDIRNVNASVTLADGSRLIIRGLTLQIGEGMPGIFECLELRQEPGGLALKGLKAQVLWEPRRVTIQNLSLPQAVILERLAVDLQGLWQEDNLTVVDLLVKLGAASFEVQAEASGLLKPPLRVKATAQGRDLRSEELHMLGLPKEVAFDQGTLDVLAEGDPSRPTDLEVDFSFSLANLRTAGAQVDAITATATVKEGKAEVKSVQVVRKENRLELTAEATLPQEAKDWATMPWRAKVQARLPQATDFLDQPPPVSGLISLNATAAGIGPTATKAEGKIEGETLAFETYKLPMLRSVFALDGKQAQFEIPSLELGAGNTLSLKTTMQMNEAMPVDVTWQMQVADPAALMSTTGLPAPPEPVKGSLNLQGKAQFNVQDVSAQEYSRVLAEMTLKLDEASYGDGKLQQVDIQTQVQDGRAVLKVGSVRLDAPNAIDLTGHLDLKAPFSFTAQGDIGLTQLKSLNAFLKAGGSPVIESGALSSDLQVVGQLQPWLCQGTLQMNATTVRTAAMPEAATVSLETTFEGTRADLKKLEATLGPWRLAVMGTVDDRQAQLAELKVWQNKTELLNGTVFAPFDLMQPEVVNGQPMKVAITAKDLRFHEILAAVGIKDIPAGILNADIQVNGRVETAQGRIWVEVKDMKIPQGPKAFQAATFRSETKLENKRLKTLTTLAQPPLQTLTIEGDVPLDIAAVIKAPTSLDSTPLQVRVRMPESDLSFLREYAPDMIRNVPAKFKLEAQVSGTVGKPVINGGLDLDILEVNWAKPDLPSVRNVRARIRATDKRINIEDVSAVLAGGRVKMGGSVDITNAQNPALDLKVEAREALVFRDPTTSLRANADITCRGTLQQATVAGLVEAVRGRVFKEIDLLPVLKLPADVPPVPPDTSRSEAKLTLPPMLKDWTFDLKVRTRDPLLISGNLANGAISADVRLSGRGSAPQLTGAANIDRLLLKLPFSVVKITKGVITLRPAHPFDPDLDIRGDSRIGSNDITLYVYGDSTNPKTRFTSTPPLSEPDIVTLLATGTTLDGSAGDLASEAATRAAFLFISEFYRKTFNKKKVVREEPPRLNMTFNPSGADRSNDSVQATYDLSENWRVTGRFTQTGRMKALLGYVLRFGQAAQAVDARPSSLPPVPPASSPTP